MSPGPGFGAGETRWSERGGPARPRARPQLSDAPSGRNSPPGVSAGAEGEMEQDVSCTPRPAHAPVCGSGSAVGAVRCCSTPRSPCSHDCSSRGGGGSVCSAAAARPCLRVPPLWGRRRLALGQPGSWVELLGGGVEPCLTRGLRSPERNLQEKKKKAIPSRNYYFFFFFSPIFASLHRKKKIIIILGSGNVLLGFALELAAPRRA